MMAKKRKICFITGARADYGILFSVMKAVSESEKLSLQLLVTGMHLDPKYGLTYDEIKKDGFNVDAKVVLSYKKNDPKEMALIFSQAVAGFTKVLQTMKPDFLVVLGDRLEMLAAAVTANFLSIPVVHIHGGEISGHVDGIMRHAITKLSHLHFAATDQAKKRILSLGEEPWRVFVSGAPALDRILAQTLPSKEELFRKYQLDLKQGLIVVVQHPVLSELAQSAQQMAATLEVVARSKIPFLIIYPNADAGGQAMIKVIERYRRNPLAQIRKSIPHLDYLSFLKYASVLVGNSSSGVIEAASFGLPVIDIGSRQSSRERGANVVRVGYSRKEIADALKKILKHPGLKKMKVKNPYHSGNAGVAIRKVLEDVPLDAKLLEKKMTY